MSQFKPNINVSNPEELLNVTGIGRSTADKIVSLRSQGVTFNDPDELFRAIPSTRRYADTIVSEMDFAAPQSVGSRFTPVNVNPGDLTLTVADFQPVLTSFMSYKVQLTGEGIDSFDRYTARLRYRSRSRALHSGGSSIPFFRAVKLGLSDTLTPQIKSDGTIQVALSLREVQSMVDNRFQITILDSDETVVLQTEERLEPDETLTLTVPSVIADKVRFDVTKQDEEDYNGFTLSYSVQVRKQGLITTQTGEVNLARENEVIFEPDSKGDVLSAEVTVTSANDQVIFNETRLFDDLEEEDGRQRTFAIELPEPSNLRLDVRLEQSPASVTNPFADYTVVVTYDVVDPETLNVLRQATDEFPIVSRATDEFVADVDLQFYGRVRFLEFEVRAPTGEVLGRRSGETEMLSEEIVIHVPPREDIDPNEFEKLPTRPDKATGRLIDPSGRRIYGDVQIVIYVSKEDAPESTEDYYPLQAIRSENTGYFSVEIPVEYFTDAFARIGVRLDGDDYVDVPIYLEEASVVFIDDDDEVRTEVKRFLPSRMILVVGSDEDEDDDCDCGSCDELNFHEKQKVLEEYTFQSVVRTTEPKIREYEYTEGEKINVSAKEVYESISTVQPELYGRLVPDHLRDATVRQDILLQNARQDITLSMSTLERAVQESALVDFFDRFRPGPVDRAPGRKKLSNANAIDWDDKPTVYQATSIAHGHILAFKQEWVNDGYSLGDLKYSLPLAPGQQKNVVVLDWEQRAAFTRAEERDYSEALSNAISRDRDINDTVRGVVRENVRGGSTSSSGSFGVSAGGGGILGGFGGFLGVSGGTSKSSASAWQNSARSSAMTAQQTLRDRTMQSANAVRSQRGTVVQTTTQGERFSVETETVANYNHCHSLTIQYFEVLRHLRIEQRLTGVQECLFIPLEIEEFTCPKILRWREDLRPALLDRSLRNGFEAMERVQNGFKNSDLPKDTYADEEIDSIRGEMQIEFRITAPPDFFSDDDEKVKKAVRKLIKFGLFRLRLEEILAATEEERRREFETVILPQIAKLFIERLRFTALVSEFDTEGVETGNVKRVNLNLDATVMSPFRNGRPMLVSLRQEAAFDSELKRKGIEVIEVQYGSEELTDAAPDYDNAGVYVIPEGAETLPEQFEELEDLRALPNSSSAILRSLTLSYRTRYMSGSLVRSRRINDDLMSFSRTGGPTILAEKARIPTPLSRRELRNPRNENRELATRLEAHLNENIEYYHKAIFSNLSPERRFMFLDGIEIVDYSEVDRYPEGVIRSVASVVENRVVGVVGNSIVMPVAPGFRLDPTTRGREIDLFALYRPPVPAEPMRISLPTKGVFAEAVMGRCNSCEFIEEDRFWRWSKEPIPNSPTTINPVSTESRAKETPDLEPTSFPPSIINQMSIPSAPDPQGFSALQTVLGSSDLFSDAMGLSQTQKNALEALKTAITEARGAGDKAAGLAETGLKQQVDLLKTAMQEGLITKNVAGSLAQKFFGLALKQVEKELGNDNGDSDNGDSDNGDSDNGDSDNGDS